MRPRPDGYCAGKVPDSSTITASYDRDLTHRPSCYDATLGRLRKAWVFVFVLAYSRWMFARIVFDQKVETWCGCRSKRSPRWMVFQGPGSRIT